MEKNDGLPEIICKKCLARLQIAYEFKRDAIASIHHLRSFILDVNKQFQQVTGTNAIPSKSVKRKQKDDDSESYDELEEDIQALVYEEREIELKEFDAEPSDDAKKTIDREKLVEILGENNAISIQKTQNTRMVTIHEETSSDEPPESMEVLLVDEEGEVEPGYIVDEYDQNTGELITDEQYLEDDDNDIDNDNENDNDDLLYVPSVRNWAHKCAKIKIIF